MMFKFAGTLDQLANDLKANIAVSKASGITTLAQFLNNDKKLIEIND